MQGEIRYDFMNNTTLTFTERQKSWLTLAALWLLLMVLAGLRPLAVPDEGRYGEIGRWMLISGDWLTPRLDGLPFFHKPPLLYWLEAISLATFGVNELALRLVPALHAGLMLIALYLGVRTVSTEVMARRAAIMLGTSLSFLVGGQYVNHDMLVATWISIAIGCFAFSLMMPTPHVGLARLGFVACALGFLSKGLIGIALPGMVILVWLIWNGQFKKILLLPWLSGLALFSAVALPWFVMAQRTYPDFFNYMFVGQQFSRYTAASYNNPQPWWFYLMVLLLLLFPWVFFAFAQIRNRSAMTLNTAWWRLCWVWILVILVFFSIPHSKLVGYILPVMPPLAFLAALGWQQSMAHRSWASRWFSGICLVNIMMALVIVLKVGGVTQSSRTEDIAAVLACAAAPTDTIYVTGAYPYDLPFYAQFSKPMVILDNWPWLRQQAGDGWQRELFEGANFDAVAAQVLQPLDILAQVAQTPGHWLVARNGATPTGWTLHHQGAGWSVYRAGSHVVTGLPAKSPEPAQHKGLRGCTRQGNSQGHE
jgi:4-amino-4-deoxy-L-arabinose transferase-like glycosyltransferase